ncbi:MAG: FAD-dependent oxidoreductase [Candidatus Altiarchaeales archaeon]|nr:FAD-dependent oxidoreductase [Candidatus Altiarchaeales archaeon]
MHDVLIIGGGPAGLSAAVYAARRKLKTLVFEKGLSGGQMQYTTLIENYPGVLETTGADLALDMERQAKKAGAKVRGERVSAVNVGGGVKTVSCGDEVFEGKTIIFATGGHHRRLQVPGEQEYTGKGVSWCATCDAPFFKDKKVAVIGGGNTAAEEALYLSEIADEVFVVHRRDTLRCEEERVERMKKNGVTFILNSRVMEFKGDLSLKSVVLATPDGEKTVDVDGCFISIGMNPESGLARQAGVKLDDRGFIEVDCNQETNREGVLAAGDVTGGVMQITVAAAEGCVAALKAYEIIKKPYWCSLE